MPWVAKKQMLYDGRQLSAGEVIGDSVKRSLQGTYAQWVDVAPEVTTPAPVDEAGPELAEASAPLPKPEPEALPPVPVPMQDLTPKRSKARQKKTKSKTRR